MPSAMLFDSSRCMACRGCQVACKQWWELPAVATTNRGSYENPPELGAETWNKIRFGEISKAGNTGWLFTRQACMHCTEAVCVWVCPSYARSYDEDGHVSIDRERCIGCGRCVQYCPFEVPRLGPDKLTPRLTVANYSPRKVAYKCTWCTDRLKDGLSPACVHTCPPGALQFGERSKIIEEARRRLAIVKKTHPQASLYGESELGGLHSIYLLTGTAYDHGLPENPRVGNYPLFDPEGFPDWYIKALKDGVFPDFPESARRDWYMEPGLTPTSPLRVGSARQSQDFFDGKQVLTWGWLGVGAVAATAALGWIYKRRNGAAGAERSARKE
jgi:formate dehydrogenase iron-sulfur subunit